MNDIVFNIKRRHLKQWLLIQSEPSQQHFETLIHRCSYEYVNKDTIKQHVTTIYFMFGVICALLIEAKQVTMVNFMRAQLNGPYYKYIKSSADPDATPFVFLARTLAGLSTDGKADDDSKDTSASITTTPRTAEQWLALNSRMTVAWIKRPTMSLKSWDTFIDRIDIVLMMQDRTLVYAKNNYMSSIWQHRIYFVTHYVYIKSWYGTEDYSNDRVLGWVLRWYQQLAKNTQRWKRNIEVFNELCTCIMILGQEHQYPDNFLNHLRIDAPSDWLHKPRTPFWFYNSLGVKQKAFEDLHTHLVAAHTIAMACKRGLQGFNRAL